MDLYNEIGEFLPDKLFAGIDIPRLIKGIRLKENMGIIKRGSVLCRDTDGTFFIAKDKTNKPEGVLTDDVDTLKETCTTIYMSGHFNKKALIFENDLKYDDFELHLRSLNIYGSDIVETR